MTGSPSGRLGSDTLSTSTASPRGPRGDTVDVLSVSEPSPALGEPVTVHLVILDHDDLRGALRPDAQGRAPRGDAAALRRLMQADGAPAA